MDNIIKRWSIIQRKRKGNVRRTSYHRKRKIMISISYLKFIFNTLFRNCVYIFIICFKLQIKFIQKVNKYCKIDKFTKINDTFHCYFSSNSKEDMNYYCYYCFKVDDYPMEDILYYYYSLMVVKLLRYCYCYYS